MYRLCGEEPGLRRLLETGKRHRKRSRQEKLYREVGGLWDACAVRMGHVHDTETVCAAQVQQTDKAGGTA